MRQTSMQAYKTILENDTEKSQLEIVYNCLKAHPLGLIFPEIVLLTGIQKTSVTARVRKLYQLGKVKADGRKINPESNVTNIVWKVSR